MDFRDEKSESMMSTNRLIELLAQDATVRTRFGSFLLKATVGAIMLAAAAFLSTLPPRQDLDLVYNTVRFLFKFAVTLPLAIAVIGLLDRIARPGAPLGPWPWLLGLPIAVLATGVLFELALFPASEWPTRLVGQNAIYCLLFIPLIAMGPLACFIVTLRRGAPSNRGLAGATAGVAASAVAAILYAFHCPDDSPLFVATWYTVATGIVGTVGYTAGLRFLR